MWENELGKVGRSRDWIDAVGVMEGGRGMEVRDRGSGRCSGGEWEVQWGGVGVRR